jgi:hypothetical protein
VHGAANGVSRFRVNDPVGVLGPQIVPSGASARQKKKPQSGAADCG